MKAPEIPVTVVECDGCHEDLNVLAPYLHVMLKPQRSVLVSEEIADEDDPEYDEDNPELMPRIYLGTKAGRGVLLKFHNFDCTAKWVGERKGLQPKIEPHMEDEIYVPEDNPDDEEIERRQKAAQARERAVARDRAAMEGDES